MGQYSKKESAGFTLVEALSVIAIVAILMSIGVPSYRSVTTSSRVSTEINSLLGDLQFARSQALKQGQPVTACISVNGSTCSSSTLWQSGWIVFSDPNANGTVDTGETVWRVQRALSGGDDFKEPNGLKAVTFNRAGFALNLPNAGVLLSVHDEGRKPTFTRCLSITTAGMMTTQTHAKSPGTCS